MGYSPPGRKGSDTTEGLHFTHYGLGTINLNQLAGFPSKIDFALSSYISVFNLISVPFSLESWVILLPLIQQK